MSEDTLQQGEFVKMTETLRTALRDEASVLGRWASRIETKTKVNREYIAIFFAVVFVFNLTFGYGAKLICDIVGFIFPAYASLKALESPEINDDKKWLTYWVTFAFFSLFIELFVDVLLWWIPFYWLCKCTFLLWLMFPGAYNGSLIIYQRIIRPFFLKNEAKIDDGLKAAGKAAFHAIADVQKAVEDEKTD